LNIYNVALSDVQVQSFYQSKMFGVALPPSTTDSGSSSSGLSSGAIAGIVIGSVVGGLLLLALCLFFLCGAASRGSGKAKGGQSYEDHRDVSHVDAERTAESHGETDGVELA